MSLRADIRFAVRGLARSPGMAAVIVLSLALAIGANTTVFTWMEGFVLRPYPMVKDAQDLVWVNTRAPNGDRWSVSYPTLRDWDREAHTTGGLAGFDMLQVNLKDGEETQQAWGTLVTGKYFDLLGVRATHGRTLKLEDEESASQVAVLGYGYWQRRFQADPGVIGRQVSLNGHGFTIVGVLPPRFGGVTVGLVFDVFVPFTAQPLLSPGNQLTDRGWQSMEAFGRLKPGVTFEQARADLEQMALEVARLNNREGEGLLLGKVYERGAAEVLLPVLGALLGVTALVLLIACANIANVLLARAGGRSKEIAVRLAMGAPRRRIVRQLITESALLALAGCTLGLLLAWWGRNGIMAFVPPAPFPIDVDLSVNYRVVLFALGLTALTTVAFGLVPALRASRPDLVPVLKDEVSGLGVSRSLLRSGLVVTQVALSVVALVSAGLFLRALQRAQQVDTGIRDPGSLLVVSTNTYLAGYTEETGPALADRLLERTRALPGVQQASLSTYAPLGFGDNSSQSIALEGYQPARDENMSIQYAFVSDQYFEALGTTVLLGRGITAEDRPTSQPVVVINQAFADRFFKGQDPLGRRIYRGGDTAVVVGLAANGKYIQITEASRPLIWRPLSQNWRGRLHLFARTSGDPKALTETLRAEFASVDPSLPFLDPRTMTEQMLPSTIAQRIGARMLGLFGTLALILSALGIYGVVAYSVSQRTREMGIRLALGAARDRVVKLVLFQSVRWALLGLLAGAGLAFGAGTLLRSQLLGVPAGDPVTYLVIATLLMGVALAASAIPALRAARIDPIKALRTE